MSLELCTVEDTHLRSTSVRFVLLVTGANLLGYMDRVCISVLAPKLRTDLGFSASNIGLIFGAFGLSYALFQVPWGMIADRGGTRIIIGGVILAWSFFKGLTAVARGLAAFATSAQPWPRPRSESRSYRSIHNPAPIDIEGLPRHTIAQL